MATLSRHGGVEAVYLAPSGTRYAVCHDGKVLKNFGQGWKLAPRAAVDKVRALPVDPTAKGIVTRANADAAAHERFKGVTRR